MQPPVLCEWELTKACNFRCPHCSASAGEPDSQELTTQEALGVARQISALGCSLVSLTGGEPLLRPDWDTVAAELIGQGLRVSLLSNGWTLDRTVAGRMRALGLSEVVLSLEGIGTQHDAVRAKPGAFERVLVAIESLQQEQVSVCITTTVFRETLEQLHTIHDWAIAQGVRRWHVLLGKPPVQGVRGAMPYEWLPPKDLGKLAGLLQRFRAQGNLELIVGDNVGIDCRSCQAGRSLLSIDPGGRVKGCSAMPSWAPYVEGNVCETGLRSIWDSPKAFAYNRGFQRAHLAGACAVCPKAETCRGGCHWSTDFVTVGIDNRYCYRRQCAPQLERRNVAVGASALAIGLGIALTGCGGGGHAASSPGASQDYPCMLERQLAEPTTNTCRTLKQEVEECTRSCCFSRAVMPPDYRQKCVEKANQFKEECLK